MRQVSLGFWLACGLVCGAVGCAGNRHIVERATETECSLDDGPSIPFVTQRSYIPRSTRYLDEHHPPGTSVVPVTAGTMAGVAGTRSEGTPHHRQIVQPVNYEAAQQEGALPWRDATITLAGKTYQVHLLEEYAKHNDAMPIRRVSSDSNFLPAPAPANIKLAVPSQPLSRTGPAVNPLPANILQLNLPTALSLVGGQHPAVGFARWRVREAYARLDRAHVLWLPSIQPGFHFNRHDGNLQASNGAIQDVNRNSFQYGLGAGAVGAGTTQRPGIVARFHFADAIFQPKVARKVAWAREHAEVGTVNQQLLTVALAYLELLSAEQDVRIVEQTHQRTAGLVKLTSDFAATGQGLRSDADRLQTELQLVEDRLATGRERADIASSQLAQALSIDAGQRIVPLDPTVVPIELVSHDQETGALIRTGLSNRPELKEAQTLVAAACEQYKRQKFAPFVPSVLLGFSTGGFGGGLSSDLENVDDRYDLDALVTWEIRNLGFGERAARHETQARVQQAKFEKVRVLDRVAREIAEAHKQVIHRAERIRITRRAVQFAVDSYERNLSRIRDGAGLPLEVLQSVRALDDATRAYLQAVISHNRAQLRLQWALGWPVTAPAETR